VKNTTVDSQGAEFEIENNGTQVSLYFFRKRSPETLSLNSQIFGWMLVISGIRIIQFHGSGFHGPASV